MYRIKFSDKIREKMKLTSATAVVCSLRVNISTYLNVYQYACAGLKTWREKLDRKLLLPAILTLSNQLSKFNIDSEDFFRLIIKEKKKLCS